MSFLVSLIITYTLIFGGVGLVSLFPIGYEIEYDL